MSSHVFLVSHEGAFGSFHHWLRDLGLEKISNELPLSSLIEWGWIEPAYRVPFPKSYLLNWQNYPEQSAKFGVIKPHWADHRDIRWWIQPGKGTRGSEWFLHPYLSKQSKAANFLAHARFSKSRREPKTFKHTNGREVHPFSDYFFHWQAYQLADVFDAAKIRWPAVATPALKIDAPDSRQSFRREIALRRRMIEGAKSYWIGAGAKFTWLSIYSGMRGAVHDGFYGRKGNPHNAIKRGAKAIAKHLAITAEDIEEFVKKDLLVIAQAWKRRMESGSTLHRVAYGKLQVDVMMAVEWICKLNGRKFDHYFKEWSYGHFGQHEWAELRAVLPYDFLAAEKSFVHESNHYFREFNALVGKRFAFTPTRLEAKLARLLQRNTATSSFIQAYSALHDHLRTDTPKWMSLDFRERQPVDQYRILAIQGELVLQKTAKKASLLFDSKGNARGLNSLILELGDLKAWPAPLLHEFGRLATQMTQLHKLPPDPMKKILAISWAGPPKQLYMLKCLLAFVLVRNYAAHHDYWNHELLFGSEAGFAFSSVLIVTLCLGDVKTREAWLR